MDRDAVDVSNPGVPGNAKEYVVQQMQVIGAEIRSSQ